MGDADRSHNPRQDDASLRRAGGVMGRRLRGLMRLVAEHAGSAFEGGQSSGGDRKVPAEAPDGAIGPDESIGFDGTAPVEGAAWPRTVDRKMARRLRLLRWLPWLYAIGFAVSFWWDFNGLAWTLPVSFEADGVLQEFPAVVPGASGADGQGALRIPFDGLLRVVCVGGLIGFLTNWLAITMLFRPSRRRPLLGHGLIPANKERIALRLAKSVSEDLINPELIKRKIHASGWVRMARMQAVEGVRSVVDREDFRTDLKAWVRETMTELVSDPLIRADLAAALIRRMEALLEDRFLERFAYRAYQFLKGADAQRIVEEAIERVPDMVDAGMERIDDLLDDLPARLDLEGERIEEWITQLLFRLVNRLDVEELVLDNLIRYDEKRLERLIKGATHEQLNYIQYLGGLLGGIGGLVIWQPLLSLGFMSVSGGLVFAADHLILRWTSSKRGSSSDGMVKVRDKPPGVES